MKCVIVGAGPTGLGAACRLSELGIPWCLFEANGYPGGLSASFEADGFTWDLGGHVLFSHYEQFDSMLSATSGAQDWIQHQRKAFIRILDRWVPYPFQNHIRCLPDRERDECLAGLAEAREPANPPATFQEWIDTFAGSGIARLFLNPYNRKVWACDPGRLSASWLAERVAVPDTSSAEKAAHWGPNRVFRFPASGGTGEIWRRLAARLEQDSIHYAERLVGVDMLKRTIQLSSGRTEKYDYLISSIPLDRLVALSAPSEHVERAASLVHNSVLIVGLGLTGEIPAAAADKCWAYFPEPDCPFYRVTVFSNYSPSNAPAGHYSLMAEVSGAPGHLTDPNAIAQDCIRALSRSGLIGPDNSVVKLWIRELAYAYPLPTLERDAILAEVMPGLENYNIFSRGRFGSWKYEVGNMDHSFMQGVEVADRIVSGKDEGVVGPRHDRSAQGTAKPGRSP
jgi:protoporphyrinogen oxidase